MRLWRAAGLSQDAERWTRRSRRRFVNDPSRSHRSKASEGDRMPERTIGDLFTEEPHTWGLRGDPHLWRAMRDHLAAVPLPPTLATLVETIEAAFLALSGHPLSAESRF